MPKKIRTPIALACLLATLLSAASFAGSRTFRGGAAGLPQPGLQSPWTRPALGSLPASPAFWESTSFYVTESGSYSILHRIDRRPEEKAIPFPRVLYVYVHRFDPTAPERGLMSATDLSDGRAEVEIALPLVANNMYFLVLSTVDETQPTDDDGYPLSVRTTVTGPGEIGRNYCRFVDDVESDADGEFWNDEAALAFHPDWKVEQMCASVTWRDQEGVERAAPVAPLRTLDSVLFYYFNEENWEINVKILDGCALNERWWLLASSSTDVEYELRVRFLGQEAYLSRDSEHFEPYFPGDPSGGGELVYRSSGGEPAQAIIDLESIVCE